MMQRHVEGSVAASPTPPRVHISRAALALLMGLFRGDVTRHARMWVDRLGRRGYAPVLKPLDEAAWRSHLEGHNTLAVALADEGHFHAAVLDVDLGKALQKEVRDNPSALLAALSRAHSWAVSLLRSAQRLGLTPLLEDSGHKGRHVWLFFAEPVPGREVFRLLQRILADAGTTPSGLEVELIPGDSSRPPAGTPLVKLPLGIHLQTGQRSTLLEPDGSLVTDLEPHLRPLRRTSRVALAALLQPPQDLEPTRAHEVADPRVQQVLARCPVMAHLVQKASELGHLRHRERLALLHVFGHLPPGGPELLHRTMARCADYDPHITDRYLERLRDAPVSCARLREWLPDVSTRVPCCCRFEVPTGLWPSPLLHLLEEGSP